VQMLSGVELGSQMVLELPDRELLSGGLIEVNGPLVGGPVDVSILENIANNSFNNWHINVLDGNDVNIKVEDNLSQNDLDAFCNQVVAVLSAQCKASLT
jgi:hypothetical protein